MAELTTGNTMTTLNGNFKQVYADDIVNLIPSAEELMSVIPFAAPSDRVGREFVQPVIVSQELGFSYGGTVGDMFALNDAIPGAVVDARVKPYEFVLRSGLSVATISRAIASQAAFEQSTKLVVANMIQSFAKRLECIMFYGRTNIGVVASNADGGGGLRVLTLTAASWAPAIWAGSINMKISAWDSSSSFADLNASGFTVKAVNIEGRTVTVLGTDANLIATSDPLTHFGAGYVGNVNGSKEFHGLQAIMENTGTLFEISASQYDLWKATTYAVDGVLTFAAIQKAIAVYMGRASKENLIVLLNPKVWENLLTDEAAARKYDSSYKKSEMDNGAEKIVFYGQNGRITLVPNPYVKESLAFAIPDPANKTLMRAGSSDVTFEIPGQKDQYFQPLPNSMGYELRAYADFALFCWQPNKLILLSGITLAS